MPHKAMRDSRDHSASDEWDTFFEASCRKQELALFALRAHRHMGRGFVLVTPDDDQPIYVTSTIGAPPPLLDAIYGYDPEHEALLVSQVGDDLDAVNLTFIRIESRH